jgi:acyl-CoA synthetase (AMP-forming)/AMP-acid ligase II
VVLQRTAARLGDRPAYFVRNPERWEGTSWREYGLQVRQAARALLSMGVQRGDAVGILSFNRPEWAITAFAAMSIGAKPAGIYWTSSVDDMAYVLNHSKAKVLMVENPERLDSVKVCADRIPHLQQVVLFKTDNAPSDFPLPQLPWSGFLALSQTVTDEALDARMAELSPDDIGTLIYTSGTTGPSKAVALSQGNLWWPGPAETPPCAGGGASGNRPGQRQTDACVPGAQVHDFAHHTHRRGWRVDAHTQGEAQGGDGAATRPDRRDVRQRQPLRLPHPDRLMNALI